MDVCSFTQTMVAACSILDDCYVFGLCLDASFCLIGLFICPCHTLTITVAIN